MSFIQGHKNGLLLKVIVQPNAKKNEVVGLHGEQERLKIKLKALPVEGKANKELINFLAKSLRIPKGDIELIRGETSKQKDLFLALAEIPPFLNAFML